MDDTVNSFINLDDQPEFFEWLARLLECEPYEIKRVSTSSQPAYAEIVKSYQKVPLDSDIVDQINLWHEQYLGLDEN